MLRRILDRCAKDFRCITVYCSDRQASLKIRRVDSVQNIGFHDYTRLKVWGKKILYVWRVVKHRPGWVAFLSFPHPEAMRWESLQHQRALLLTHLTCGTLQALLPLLDPNYQQHRATLLQNSAPSKQLILINLNQALNPGGIYLPYWRILEPANLDMKMVLIYKS